MFAKHFTKKEWRKFASQTMHGSLPKQTVQRLFATVDKLFFERDRAIELLRDAVNESGPVSQDAIDFMKLVDDEKNPAGS